jgi:hypothetical protein
MDIEKVQKINRLAKELVDHKMARDMDEATLMAEGMVDRDSDKETKISDIRREVNKEEKQRGDMNATANESEFMKHLKQLNNVIIEHDKIIVSLHNKIEALSSQLDGFKTQHRMEIDNIKLNQKPAVVLERREQQPQTTLQQSTPKPHARSGNYNSDDVSVEKMFYTGNR